MRCPFFSSRFQIIRPIAKIVLDWSSLARLFWTDRTGYQIIRRVIRDKLSYLRAIELAELYDSVRQVEATGYKGMIIEAGTALGGSALVMATAKRTSRPFFIYDAFERIPAPSERDGQDAHQRYQVITSGQSNGIGGEKYYGYKPNLLEQVTKSFIHYGFTPADHNIRLIQGLYEQTLQITTPVAMAHLDCDWHDSVMICLERIIPYLVKGGRVIIDDYLTWSGCRTAVDTYFANRKNEFAFVTHQRLHIIRR